ncbi:hypothetical protein [Moorena producens]|uniref:hypothetical protein n=1 Tax=Moorena producens TaxID=1155739 RepID=UPI001E62D133|nr:hypothetical protein [Moorena producens]
MWNWHLASDILLVVELASCQWFYRWNWHLASGSTGGTGILPVVLQVELASCQ